MKPAETPLDLLSATAGRSYAPDQPLAELGFAEQFVVWCLRVQWRMPEEGKERSVLLQRAFDALDLPGGAALVAELAGALTRAVRRPLTIACPRWRVLTGDEVRVLNFIAALQHHGASPRAALDPSWVAAPCGASPVWAPAQRFALALSAAGLTLGNAHAPASPFPEAMPRILH